MAIRKYKPTTPGRRGSSVADVELTRSTPEKSLLVEPQDGQSNNAARSPPGISVVATSRRTG